MTPRIVSATRLIPAPAEKIFDLLASPEGQLEIDGSGTIQSVKSNPDRLSLGSKFAMHMKMGVPYTVTNTVSEFEENRVIAWHHFAQFVWRYELEAVDGGTKVTESFDYSKPWGVVLGITGKPEHNRADMVKTLERIEELVTAP
jgi:uncharacterized protein YndB with AHSA1/START domain